MGTPGRPSEGITRAADGAPLGWWRWANEGRPRLLILHGGAQAASQYGRLATALSRTFDVYACDRRGRGRSAPLRAVPDFEAELDDLRRVFDEVRPAHLFGHSAGARYAAELALGRRLDSLAFYEPPFEVPMAWLPAFREALGAGRRGRAFRLMLEGMEFGPKGRWPAWVLEALCALLLRGRAGEERWELLQTLPAEFDAVIGAAQPMARLAALTTPTLLLGGDVSPRYLRDALEQLERLIPGARRIVFAGQGHNAPDQSAPEQVAEAIVTFTGGTRG